MLLSEIKDDQSLISHVLRKLMKTNAVQMWYTRDNVDHQVEIVDVEDNSDGWIKVHFGIPNERSGEVTDNDWHEEDFEVDKVTVTKNDKGEWWLHEID